METSYILFISLLFCTFLSLIVMIYALLQKPVKHNKYIKELAQDLGLEVLHKQTGKRTHDIEGSYKGKIIRIYFITHHENGFSAKSTAIRLLGPNPLLLTFTIFSRTWLRNFEKFLGFKRLRFIDPEFDKFFVVKTNQPEIMQQLLTDTIRTKFLKIKKELDFKGGMKLDKHAMFYLEHEPIDSEHKRKRFEAIVNLMCCLRDELDIYFKEK